MSSVFKIYYEDALDHCTEVDSYDTYEEAKVAWEKCVKDGPEDYDVAVELCEVVDDYEDMITHDYHEWFSQEEWDEAHPSGFVD